MTRRAKVLPSLSSEALIVPQLSAEQWLLVRMVHLTMHAHLPPHLRNEGSRVIAQLNHMLGPDTVTRALFAVARELYFQQRNTSASKRSRT